VKFNKSDKIQFISIVDGLESVEECLPRPSKHFIPKWFKDIPNNIEDTVKICPSFPDYFSQGYIIPMWCDSKIQSKDGFWSWETSDKRFEWTSHDNHQLLDHTDANFNGVPGNFVFKPNSPWRIITPPGWSVLQLPLFYHFNKEWSVLPGIIDTDIYHETNQQVLYHGNGEPVLIKRGDPFALYIPFKRSEKLKSEVRYRNEKDQKILNKSFTAISTKFHPNGLYRSLQRKRDKDVL
jgi:hypothetical protein